MFMVSRGFSPESLILLKRQDIGTYMQMVEHAYIEHNKEMSKQRITNLIDISYAIGSCVSKEGYKAFTKHYKELIKSLEQWDPKEKVKSQAVGKNEMSLVDFLSRKIIRKDTEDNQGVSDGV